MAATQEYKLVVRTVWGGATILESGAPRVQNLDEFLEYVNAVYLAEGFKVLSVDSLGEVIINELEGTNSPRGLRFAYHLVRDVK